MGSPVGLPGVLEIVEVVALVAVRAGTNALTEGRIIGFKAIAPNENVVCLKVRAILDARFDSTAFCSSFTTDIVFDADAGISMADTVATTLSARTSFGMLMISTCFRFFFSFFFSSVDFAGDIKSLLHAASAN